MRKDTGFTLMEVMIAIAIIGILCGIATPNMIKWLPRHRVGSAAREVMSTVEFARISAIKTNADVTVVLDWGDDSLTVVDAGGNTLRTRRLTGNVDLDDIDLGGSVVFNGHGFSTTSGSLMVQNKMDAAINRRINLTLGGNVSIQ